MRDRIRFFLAAFAISAIVIGGMCGFMAVDLSSERYMPGQYMPMFQISRIDGAGMLFSFMGSEYLLGSEPFIMAGEALYRFRGFLPAEAGFAREGLLCLKNVLEAEEEDPYMSLPPA